MNAERREHDWIWQKPEPGLRQCQRCGKVLKISDHVKVGECEPQSSEPPMLTEEEKLATYDSLVEEINELRAANDRQADSLELACDHIAELEATQARAVEQARKEERNRVHVEINKMLEPLKLHLSWIASADIASEQYGLADEDGDDIDIGVIESALEAWDKNE